MVDVGNDVLVYDIETRTFGKPDSDKDRLRIFGCYSYKTKKQYLLTKKEDIQKAIDAHKFLVGFNNMNYDDPILKREGIKLDYKICIDLMRIFENRAGGMKVKKGMLKDLLMQYSLDYITKVIGIVDDNTGKEKIDYKMFQKDIWTEEERKQIAHYTKRDIEVTKKLYEWVEEYFESFKEFMIDEDIRKKKYLTDALSVYTYKVICKELCLEPEFGIGGGGESYGGGYVAYPAGERFVGNILCFDFSSLYPNLFMQCNLFSDECDCCEHDEKWHGDGFFNVEGYYCTKKQGKIEKLLKKLYLMRKEFKSRKDPREYACKIILNTSYGLTGNPSFKHLYKKSTASDCTSLGRQCIIYARKIFRENGFLNIATDTDSIFIQIPDNKTQNDAITLAKDVVKELQSHMIFPW